MYICECVVCAVFVLCYEGYCVVSLCVGMLFFFVHACFCVPVPVGVFLFVGLVAPNRVFLGVRVCFCFFGILCGFNGVGLVAPHRVFYVLCVGVLFGFYFPFCRALGCVFV